MEFSLQELSDIVERASTLAERLGPGFQPKPAAENERRIQARLEQWRQACAYGSQEKFERRLAWDGLDIQRVSPVLGAVEGVGDQPLPAWTETLQAALRAAGEAGQAIAANPGDPAERRPGYIEPDAPLPFEELLIPFVDVARQKLRAQAGAHHCLLSQLARETLERSLLADLSTLSALAFNLEFSIFRMVKKAGAFQPWGQPSGAPGRELYQAFIQEMLSEKLLAFFQTYSVLARLMATVVDFWIASTADFLARLTADWTDLEQTFQAGTTLGQVAALQPALSDRHHRGQMVIALKFSSGLKLVYKPRSLGLETAYFQFLAWLNNHGAPLPFKVLSVLDRATHGWVEYVAPVPCQDEAEATRYYRRAGMLLAILYALEATDCHYQNIIACGEQPVLIDVEGLMQHRMRWPGVAGDQSADAQALARQEFLDSVLRTSFLPRWEFGPNGQEAYDLSGLGAVGEQELQWQTMRWFHINSDQMRLAYEPGTFESYANAPLQKGVDLSPGEGNAALVAGFEQMYRFLVEYRAALLAPTGPLPVFARQWPRLILRNTRGYHALLRKSVQPNFLRDGVDQSIQFDVLSRWMLAFGQQPLCWPLLAVEQQALAQLDIPHFAAPAESDAMPLPDGPVIANFFIQSSYGRVIARLNQLGEADLARQLEYIEAAIYTRFVGDPHGQGPATSHNRFMFKNGRGQQAPIDQATLIQQAIEIAAQLQQRAITTPDGRSAAWVGLQYAPDAQRYQLQPLGYDLYSGGGGIALFLAGLARITGARAYYQLAQSAVQPLRQAMADLASPKRIAAPEKVVRSMGLGGATGLGSLLYVLTQAGHLLDDPSLLEEARRAVRWVDPDLIAADEKFDVMLGAAGTILGLLSLYRITGDNLALERAEICGRHLLDKRVASPTGHRAWPTLRGKFLTGFAHGAAGISYALLRLYEATATPGLAPNGSIESGDSAIDPAWPGSLLEAAAEAIAYEQGVFSPEAGNWPDFRKGDDSSVFGLGWCHGAPGIGLARLGGLPILDRPDIRQDIAMALQTTQQAGLAGVDHLCCGNFGHLELFLAAARQQSDPELLQTAHQQAAQIVTRAKQAGAFCLSPQPNQTVYYPGFFQGLAGIGYGLLRVAEPELLPSVLLWA